jgi:hypothetical protein
MALTEQSGNRQLETMRHKNAYGFHMCLDLAGAFTMKARLARFCMSPEEKRRPPVNSQKRTGTR